MKDARGARRRAHGRTGQAVVAGLALLAGAAGPAVAVEEPTHDLVVAGTVRTMTGDNSTAEVIAGGSAPVIDLGGVLLQLPAELAGTVSPRQPVEVTLRAPESMDAATATLAAGQPGAGVVEIIDVTVAGEATPAPALAGEGARTVTVLPVDWGTPGDAAALAGAVEGAATYWESESSGRLSIDVTIHDSITVPYPQTCDVAALYNLALAVHDWPPTDGADPVLVRLPSDNVNCRWVSESVIGGPQLVTSAPTAASIAHQFGHALGLGHSGAISCTGGAPVVPPADTCTVSSGGDRWDVMSGTSDLAHPEHLNTALAAALGWTQAIDPTPGEQLVVDLPLSSALDQVRALRIPLPDGSDLFVENRRDSAPHGKDGVHLVRLFDDDGVPVSQSLAMYNWWNRTMRVGDLYSVPGTPFTVAVLSRGAESARVSVSHADLDSQPPTAPVITAPTGGWVVQSEPTTVQWTASTDAGLGLVGYRVLVDGVLSASPSSGTVVPADATSGEVRVSSGPHTIEVVAMDAAGNLTTSAPVTVEGGRAPSWLRVTSVEPGDGSLTVTWSSVAVQPAVTSFVVSASPANVSMTVDGSTTSATLTGLPNRTYQTVRVTAINPLGSITASSAGIPASPDEWIQITGPAADQPVISSLELTWEVGPALVDAVWYFEVSLWSHDIRFLPGDARSVSIPVDPINAYDTTVTAYGWDGDPIVSDMVHFRSGDGPTVFPDVPLSHRFYEAVLYLAQAGITTGYADGRFHPESSVNRDAMAAFLYRVAAAELNGYEPPDEPIFRDVPLSHPFYTEISWLAESGITTGYADGTYRPSQPVNRDAMAAFLYRSVDAGEDYTPPDEQYFDDVPMSHQFFTEIAWMADYGLTTGYPDWTFRPSIAISRDAMAAFLYRLYY